MQLIYAGFAVFILTALPLLILGKALGTELIAFGGALLAMLLLITGATSALWRMFRSGRRDSAKHRVTKARFP